MSLNLKKSTLPNEHLAADELVYFIGADISSGSISITTHDGAYSKSGLGIKKIPQIDKYEVDVLGNARKCGKEQRKSLRKE